VDIWGFIFCLAAAIVLVVQIVTKPISLTVVALLLFVLGFILTFAATSSTLVHF